MAGQLNFSLTQLKYVLAVHKYGNFSLAAKNCFVTQPTLSMQIQKLEEELGTVIFDRSKKPILLTDKGRKLIDQMQSILSEAKKIEVILQSESEKALSGELTIGVIPTIAPYLLPLLLPVVEKMYPGLRLKILELQTHRIIESLDSDEIDLGILAIPLGNARLLEKPLYWEPFSVLCQKTHKLAKQKKIKYESLESDDIWLLEEGHCLRHQVLDVCSIRKRKATKRNFEFESGSLETLKNLVSAYGGYTLLPALATKNLDANLVVIPSERPIPAREIGMVSRREHYKQHLQVALETAIMECIPDSLKNIRRKDLEVVPV